MAYEFNLHPAVLDRFNKELSEEEKNKIKSAHEAEYNRYVQAYTGGTRALSDFDRGSALNGARDFATRQVEAIFTERSNNLMKKQVEDSNAFNAWNATVKGTKGIVEIPDQYKAILGNGDYVIKDGVLTLRKSIEEEATYEAAVKAGTMKKVPIGNGFGYVPVGSAGDLNLKNIGTNNTANEANNLYPPGATQDSKKNIDNARNQINEIKKAIQDRPNQSKELNQELKIWQNKLAQYEQSAVANSPEAADLLRANPDAYMAKYGGIGVDTGWKQPASATQDTTQETQLLKVGTGTKEAPNEEVRRIQSLLGATPDGIFGPQTKSKVMAFQQANGLVVDGIVGPETLAALNKTGSISTNTGNTGFNINQPSYVVKPGDKFDPYTGKPLANTTPGSVVKNPQEEIQGINNQANAEAEKDLALFKETLGNKVDVSDTKKLVDAITKTYETGPSKEATSSLEEKFANKRTELKLDVKEAELASIDASLEKLDSDWLALQQKEENRLVSLGQMNRRKSAQQIEYERARDELSRKRNSIVRELDMKYGVINTFMQYAEKDYENAQSEYNTKINQAISITNLLKNVEESQKSDNEKIMDNARANVQVMLGALKGKKFPELDSKTKLELKNMEIQAGLPAGFVEFAMSAVDDPIVSIGGEFTDASGKRQVPIYTKDPGTGVVSTKVVTIGTDAGKVNEAKNEADDIAAAILDFKNAMKQNNWRGINPDAYNYYKTEILRLYGASAVLKLDKAIKDAGLQVDDGNFKSTREG